MWLWQKQKLAQSSHDQIMLWSPFPTQFVEILHVDAPVFPGGYNTLSPYLNQLQTLKNGTLLNI